MKQRTNKPGIAKNLVLWALIVLTTLSGIWLLVSPTLEKQSALDEQNRLLAEIDAAEYYDDYEPDIFLPTAFDVSVTYVADETPEPEVVPAPVTIPKREIGEGIGILEIDKIDLKLPVVEGVTEECLKTAVGRVPETAPIGETGNAVIAGHRSYAYGNYFNRLGEMETGDIITYTSTDGETMQFEVFEITEIEPGDQIAFVQPKDESIITLYTCTPVRTATHRLLVRAEKI